MASKTVLRVALTLAALIVLATSATAQTRRFVANFTEWGVYPDHNYVPADIPADKLTHINYAFVAPVDVSPDGSGDYRCQVNDSYAAYDKRMPRLVPGTLAGEDRGTFRQLRRLRTYQASRGKSLGLILSIGGWGYAEPFSQLAADSTRRASFADSCVALMQQEGFDGIELDWEYPATSESGNFTALVADFRARLGTNPRTGSPYLLAMAGPGDDYYLDHYDVAALAPYLDWVDVMTYDYHGCWGIDHTGHAAPLHGSAQDPDGAYLSGADAIASYLSRGMPAGKLNYGLSYYGKIFQAITGPGPNPAYPWRFAPMDPAQNDDGTCAPGTTEPGNLDYWDIAQNYVPNTATYTRVWDAEQGVPYLYRTGGYGAGGYWITYDDTASIAGKVDYARTAGLGGIFTWELSQEAAPGTAAHPLTDVAAAHLNP